MNDDLRSAIISTANSRGLDPTDLATAISYETGGTFDPWKRGPTTKWGTHRGLIQWGEPQQREYGVYQGMSNADQMAAVGKYLDNAGVKPGMGLLDIYSAINAGHVGRYGASDGPGNTVRSHVDRMNAEHRMKASQLIGGTYTPVPPIEGTPIFQGPNPYSDVRPVDVRNDQEQRDWNQQQEEHRPYTFFEAVPAAIQSDWALSWALRDAGSRAVDPDFAWKPQDFSEATKDVPETYHEYILDAHSQGDAEARLQWAHEDMIREQRLGAMGLSGTGIRLATSLIDPTAILATAATEGAAGPLIASMKAAKVGRILLSAAASGAGNALAEAASSTVNPKVSPDDIISSFGVGAILGGAVGALRMNPHTQEEANILLKAGQQAANPRDTTALVSGTVPVAPGSGGAAAVGARPHLMNDTPIIEDGDAPKAAFGGMRFDVGGQLGSSDSEITRTVAAHFGEEAVGFKDRSVVPDSATVVQKVIHGEAMANWQTVVNPAFKKWAQERGVWGLFKKPKAWEQFQDEVAQYVEKQNPPVDTSPHIVRAAQELRAITSNFADLATNPLRDKGGTGAPLFETQPDQFYLPKYADHEKINDILERHDYETVRRFVKQAVFTKRPDMDPELADRIASGWLKRITQAGYGMEDRASMALAQGDRDAFKEAFAESLQSGRTVKSDLSDDDINAIFDEIIHEGRGRSVMSDNPAISVRIPPGASAREQAVALTALKARGQSDGTLPKIGRAMMPALQGLTLNSSDEIASGLDALMGAITGGNVRDTYSVDQEIQRQELARQQSEHPLASLGSELAGGLVTGLGAARQGATIVGNMANEGIANIVPRMAAGAAEGAAYGGIAGFNGAGGDVGTRLKAASDNSWGGAALGAGAVPLVDAIGAGGRVVSNLMNVKDPQRQAENVLFQALQRDKKNPEVLAQSIEDAAAAGQPEYRALDAAGRNTQKKGKLAFQTPGAFRDEAATALAARQAAQGERIGGYVSDVTGVKNPDAFGTEQALRGARSAKAEEAFSAADRAPAPTDPFYIDTLRRQSVQDAMSTVRRIAAERQMPISDLFADIPNPNPTTRQVPSSMMDQNGQPIMRTEILDPVISVPNARGWRMVKEALDTAVNTGFASQDAATRAGASAIKETRNALRDRLAADNPAYGDALRQFRDDSGGIDAVQQGRDLVKASNPDEAAAAFREIAPGDVSLGRLGGAREIGAKLDNARSGQDKTLTFDTPSMKNKLDLLAEDPARRPVFDERMSRERDMVRANRLFQGGSDTAENIGERNDAASGGALAALFTGHPLLAAGKASGYVLGGLSRRMAGLSEEGANNLGRYLMSADPEEIRKLSGKFADFLDAQQGTSLAPSAITGAVNAPRDGRQKHGR